MSANQLREIDRRKLNITEGLILAALTGVGVLIFRMNDSLTRLEASTSAAAISNGQQMAALQTQLAAVPAVAERMSRVEVRMDSAEQGLKELRGMRNLK